MEVPIAKSSTNDSMDIDDECNSENSFGSDFGDDTTIQGNLTTNDKIELESPPPTNPYTAPRLNETALNKLNANHSGPSMCVVCNRSPAYSKGRVSYPTCGLTCASKMPKVPSNQLPFGRPSSSQHTGTAPSSAASQINPRQSRGSASQMCDVCHVRPRARRAGKIYRTCGFTCDAALTNSRVGSKGNVSTLDPEIVALSRELSLLDHSSGAHDSPPGAYMYNSHDQYSRDGYSQSPPVTRTQTAPIDRRRRSQVCVVCRVQPCYDDRYVTCGLKCAETLCKRGSSNPKLCDYCHRRPKVSGHNQCGDTCRNNASKACLLCRCRPKFGRYPLCGRTCKNIATKWTPLVLEARPGHAIYAEVEKRFKGAWGGGTCPAIKHIYKIIENKSFLLPYDQYKRRVGNEAFRYHGTSRACSLGSQGNTQLCSSTACALCSILRTSFKVSLARNGCFGPGIYTSSAANKAYGYTRGGSALILTKVVLGTVYNTAGYVSSCPSGHDSVVYGQNGSANETIVYNDDAIRPVYLLTF